MAALQLMERLGLHNHFLYEEMCSILSESEATLFHPHNTGEGYGNGEGEGSGCGVGDGRDDGSCWSLEPPYPCEGIPDADQQGSDDDAYNFYYYSPSSGRSYIPFRP